MLTFDNLRGNPIWLAVCNQHVRTFLSDRSSALFASLLLDERSQDWWQGREYGKKQKCEKYNLIVIFVLIVRKALCDKKGLNCCLQDHFPGGEKLKARIITTYGKHLGLVSSKYIQ